MKRSTRIVLALVGVLLFTAALAAALWPGGESDLDLRAPRTDLAPEPNAGDAPLSTKPDAMPNQQGVPASAPRTLPTGQTMDVANPPQWTEPLVIPTDSPKRPNPDVIPEVHVDPRRLP